MRPLYYRLPLQSIAGAPMSEQNLPDLLTEKRIEMLRQQLADLKKRLPAHSISPALMQQMDELEEALQEALARQEQADPKPPTGD